ncbi:hypothetical protein P167DRAFT_538047 [Morchella conica CCBAS932]|uniref:Uncharacterized protein n=1 Tax=Morchella conica CCBAS932 TaxID=1392247 RepID=A0A3N4KHG9_9PEZI|nr:hypothetical protein P167DRAFT_538047 [Morchella conica CCBAS932]
MSSVTPLISQQLGFERWILLGYAIILQLRTEARPVWAPRIKRTELTSYPRRGSRHDVEYVLESLFWSEEVGTPVVLYV